MKRSIPHNIENYNQISINELELENLNEKDYLTIRLFIKKYNKKPTIGIVLTIFVGLFYLGITIYNIYLNRLNQKDYWMFVFCAGWFLVALFMYLERISSNKSLKKAQIGNLNTIWSIGISRESKKYYFDTIFTNFGTRYRKAECLLEDYKNAQPNCRILVFSVDNKKAYGILLEE